MVLVLWAILDQGINPTPELQGCSYGTKLTDGIVCPNPALLWILPRAREEFEAHKLQKHVQTQKWCSTARDW